MVLSSGWNMVVAVWIYAIGPAHTGVGLSWRNWSRTDPAGLVHRLWPRYTHTNVGCIVLFWHDLPGCSCILAKSDKVVQVQGQEHCATDQIITGMYCWHIERGKVTVKHFWDTKHIRALQCHGCLYTEGGFPHLPQSCLVLKGWGEIMRWLSKGRGALHTVYGPNSFLAYTYLLKINKWIIKQ